MKTIIAGTRTFEDYELLKSHCRKCIISEVVSGKAYGADMLGEYYAKEYNIPITEFPADWSNYGKSAGYIRNKLMAEYAEQAIIFWDGKSRGSMHMINLAKAYGLNVIVIKYE